MPRNDGNKMRKEEVAKIKQTQENIKKNEKFLSENAGELTPHQLKDVKEHLASKKKFLAEEEGTLP
ncbi:Hypothetical protein DEACI_2462 [Acididesulfobacillus acetoxydans]|uniref:Uncharacterized protein n=1 Tax=Acididesulfobacillus acetoxydans TaxID=1561005 RepID=A0A8S0VXD1_9FIRM|nr:hypothetical protein [Acididesulfobacillus acetoxydans]CAA7601793.1 Hypothetical protein DEACI_2462 [Acididesulfobacillus acetoxydans]CEJ09213.1 Hypothetical protein DEACI_3697 [Acididesulfobacillus acetoxydans]